MIEEAKRQYAPERCPVTYLHGDVATCITTLEGKGYAGFVCGGSRVLHLTISTIEQLACQLFVHTQSGGKGIISVFDWSYFSSSPSWTPRAFHESSDGRVCLVIEMFHPGLPDINTTIIELNGEISDEWRMCNTNFHYFRHSPSLIRSIYEQVQYKALIQLRLALTEKCLWTPRITRDFARYKRGCGFARRTRSAGRRNWRVFFDRRLGLAGCGWPYRAYADMILYCVAGWRDEFELSLGPK